jgi:Fe2+ or Zn2+ uptake regulation protein
VAIVFRALTHAQRQVLLTATLRQSAANHAVLDAIDRLHQRTDATAFARRDIVAEEQAAGTSFERQTVYRCLRRMAGEEPGSVYRDLKILGNGQVAFAVD